MSRSRKRLGGVAASSDTPRAVDFSTARPLRSIPLAHAHLVVVALRTMSGDKLDVGTLEALRAKPLRLQMKLGNNVLKGLREARGFSAASLAAEAGISYGSYLEIENLREKPYRYSSKTLKHEWREVVLKLSKYYGVLPEHLFPADVLMVEKNTVETSVSSDDLGQLLLGAAPLNPEEHLAQKEIMGLYEQALRPDTRRGRRLIEAVAGRSDNATWDEIGGDLGVSKDRARQLVIDTAKHRIARVKMYLDRGEKVPRPQALPDRKTTQISMSLSLMSCAKDARSVVSVIEAALAVKPKDMRDILRNQVSAVRTKKVLAALERIKVLRFDKKLQRWVRGSRLGLAPVSQDRQMYRQVDRWDDYDKKCIKRHLENEERAKSKALEDVRESYRNEAEHWREEAARKAKEAGYLV